MGEWPWTQVSIVSFTTPGYITSTTKVAGEPSAIDALRDAVEPDVKEIAKRAKPITDKALLPIVEQLQAEIAAIKKTANEAHAASVDVNTWYKQPDGAYQHGYAIKYLPAIRSNIDKAQYELQGQIQRLKIGLTWVICTLVVLVAGVAGVVVWK